MKTIVNYAYSDERLKFSKNELLTIEQNGNMAIFKGKALTLIGYKDHVCDCDLCETDFEDIRANFCSKEEAEKYIKDYDILDAEFIDDGCLFIKAVEQTPIDFGLFEEKK